MQNCIAAFLLACSFAVPSLADETDWNQWRGPLRDGSIASNDWPDKLTGELELTWQQDLAASYSGPVTWGDLVFTTETIDSKTERVSAFEIQSGKLRWAVDWPGAMTVPFFAAANGAWIRATPAVNENYLVVLGMRDVLVALDPHSGKELWRDDFPAMLGSPLQQFGAVCSPLIDGHAVYVHVGGGFTKVSLKDGGVIWQTLKDSEDKLSEGSFSSPIIATLAGKRQIVVQTREELCGVDLESGDILWREKIEAYRGMNILTPLVMGDSVFTAAHSGTSQMFDISKSDASWQVKEVWKQKSQGYMSSPVVLGNSIYLHQKNQRFTALSKSDGTVQWTTPPYGKYFSIIHNESKLLILDELGDLYLANQNANDFEIIDQQKVAENAWAHVALKRQSGSYWVVIRDLKSLKVYKWQ